MRGRVTIYSRKIISDDYLAVGRALEKVKADAVIDGELVAFDAHGISLFQLLQNALRAPASGRHVHRERAVDEGAAGER